MAENFVNEKIASKKVVVFSKSFCPYCVKAKTALQKHVGKALSEADYEVIELDKGENCDRIQDYLQKLTGARTVPRVFINQKCVGGGTDVESLEASGKLVDLLK